jgi:hypothetical protein
MTCQVIIPIGYRDLFNAFDNETKQVLFVPGIQLIMQFSFHPLASFQIGDSNLLHYIPEFSSMGRRVQIVTKTLP